MPVPKTARVVFTGEPPNLPLRTKVSFKCDEKVTFEGLNATLETIAPLIYHAKIAGGTVILSAREGKEEALRAVQTVSYKGKTLSVRPYPLEIHNPVRKLFLSSTNPDLDAEFYAAALKKAGIPLYSPARERSKLGFLISSFSCLVDAATPLPESLTICTMEGETTHKISTSTKIFYRPVSFLKAWAFEESKFTTHFESPTKVAPTTAETPQEGLPCPTSSTASLQPEDSLGMDVDLDAPAPAPSTTSTPPTTSTTSTTPTTSTSAAAAAATSFASVAAALAPTGAAKNSPKKMTTPPAGPSAGAEKAVKPVQPASPAPNTTSSVKEYAPRKRSDSSTSSSVRALGDTPSGNKAVKAKSTKGTSSIEAPPKTSAKPTAPASSQPAPPATTQPPPQATQPPVPALASSSAKDHFFPDSEDLAQGASRNQEDPSTPSRLRPLPPTTNANLSVSLAAASPLKRLSEHTPSPAGSHKRLDSSASPLSALLARSEDLLQSAAYMTSDPTYGSEGRDGEY